MSLQPATIQAGLDHLRSADRVMRSLIDQVGPFALSLERNRFQALVGSIIAQQISGAAARSIGSRLKQLLAPENIAPETLSRLTPAQLRQAGLSPQKSAYLLDLSQKVLCGEIRLRRLPRLPDEEVIRHLVQVKGIGVWTAQMFLIFSLGRMDVFPHDDLGIRVALRNLYRLNDLPDKSTSHQIAEPWRPFATLASWYCWRSLDLLKKSGKGSTS
jgi:DNA-3-methyladenine glycosylase II